MKIELHKRDIDITCARYCSNYSRSDLMQDVLLETWKSLGKFKKNCQFSTWVNTIARNVCISAFRKQIKLPVFEDISGCENDIVYDDNEYELEEQAKLSEAYDNLLDSLNAGDRSLIEMYAHGLSYKEISLQTGISENALRRRVNYIKCKAKIYLKTLTGYQPVCSHSGAIAGVIG